jgi:organic radical activating enzyme
MADHLNNFCALPFGHVSVRPNGDFAVCCKHTTPTQHVININHALPSVWESSEYLDNVRQAFIKNERHPGCDHCWQKEDQNIESLRKRIIGEYKILGIKNPVVTLVNVELQIENTCNLKCFMCDENSSSALLAENIRLGINKIDQKSVTWTATGFENLKELLKLSPKVLNIRGGEPLYTKPLLEIIEQMPVEVCSQTLLHITTNATQISPRWIVALEKFKLVRFMFSIDATEDLYNYMRFPGNWKDTVDTVDYICSMKNVKTLVHCVVQNLNVGRIGDLINWCKSKNLYLELDQLTYPAYLGLTNLPLVLKKSAIAHLELVLQSDLDPHIQNFITQSHIQLVSSLDDHDNDLWKTFQTQIGARDSIRNNSHKLFLTY